mmetsp:Transcript_22408/g.55433  ORF Transcript_22408/g.55433 Transcript_22408/m.55433 type:complete len:456 (+) Transcript_22408:96-1463(+)
MFTNFESSINQNMTSTQGQHLDQKQLLSEDGADVVPSKTIRLDEKSEDGEQQDALKAIRTMLNREQASYSIDNDETSAKPFSVFVKPNHRKRMVEWCLTMVGTMELRRETIERAINCIDRFILLKRGRILLSDPKLYQRAVVTALYLMIKLHEEEAIPIEDMAYVCSGGDENGETSDDELAHTSDQLAAMEIVLLAELQWEINPPTSYEYMAQFLKLLKLPVGDQFLPVQDDAADAPEESETNWLLDLAVFEVEQNLQDYDCWKKGAFHSAFNAVMNALPMLNGGEEMAERLATLLSAAVPDLKRYRSKDSSAPSRLSIVEEESVDTSSLSVLDGEEPLDPSSLSALDDQSSCSDASSSCVASSDDSVSTASGDSFSVIDVLPEEPFETVISISYILPGSTEELELYTSQHLRAEMGDIKLELEDNESPACVMDRGLSSLTQTSLVAQTKDLLED